tara:strand:+ start:410 stop:796 length:387 start_codon:yes stop_codon:yes gene_type:complete
MSYYYPVDVRLNTTAGAADNIAICFHERMQVVAVKIVDHDGITADTTNYAVFQVLGSDKATALYQWSTLNSAQGALTANTSADMVAQGAEDKAIFEAGEVLIVKVTKNSSGKSTNASVCLQMRQARSY